MKKRTTIQDVAQMAGVSKATVSRTLSGDYPVSKKTQEAVRRAVHSLGYTASIRARSLATGRSDAIAVIISEPLDTFFADPTFSRILRGITDGLAGTSIVPVLVPTATYEEQKKAIRLITNQAVDAVIHLSPWADEGLLNSLSQHNIPVVVCGQDDQRAPHSPDFSHVYSDDKSGAAQAALHLQTQGAAEPIAILGVPNQPAATDRYQGYLEVFPHLDESHVRWGGWSEAAGADAMKDILKGGVPFDSLLAASDRIARGAIAVLENEGLKVPDDILVVGYDDHPTATETSPQLTTVSQPMHEQGRVACRVAQEMIDGARARVVLLNTELHVRETA
ncbi:LacI family DNA-binding transcriptional regulator [Schaalia vaccimaxillae]|uniref:LacI family DNA-binding transcriptional regulator n=1 Tax=Schaalia vaccimaxillae TaxID=183916 RepID=UPI0003B45CFB|nr:LacI family DNA-binding transcriptional regulator [Schaalia vaccimaxillae]